MPFKINISEKGGKTYKIEIESEAIIGKELHDKISGEDISPELKGYELEITGASDKSGFTAMKDVEGIGLKKVLLTYGKGMQKRHRKEGKKKLSNKRPKGLRLRRSVRGKIISPEISQINLKVLKQGDKKLLEIFPDQNKIPEPEVKPAPAGVPSDSADGKVPKETKPVEMPSKVEDVQEKEKKEEKELTQPDKEPKGEVPKEGIEEAK